MLSGWASLLLLACLWIAVSFIVGVAVGHWFEAMKSDEDRWEEELDE